MDSYSSKHNRHEVMLGRLATHLYNEYSITSLDEAYKAARLIILDGGEITSLTKVNKATSKVSQEVSKIIGASWSTITDELNDTAIYEQGYYAEMFGSTNGIDLSIQPDKKIASAVNNSLITLHSGSRVKSDVWTKHVANNSSYVTEQFNAQIKAGFSNDETLTQITKRLKTVKDGILKRDAETLVRTGMNHFATQSREVLMKANKALVPNKYFNSVFDNRRTLICAGYAENPLYAIDDKSAPVLPLHYNERSNWLYLIAGQTEPQGTRSAVGGQKGKEAKENFEKRETALNKRRNNENITGKTSSKVKYRGKKDGETFKAGQIKGTTSSDSWLRSQPNWFIDSSLGKARADKFRAGATVDSFTDLTGKTLTLAQLAAKGI